MDYFDLLPKTIINGKELTNISNLFTLSVKHDAVYYPYTIEEGESIYDIANKIYGKDELYWLVLLANPGLIFADILDTERFNQYISDNYNVTSFKVVSPLPKAPANTTSLEILVRDSEGTVCAENRYDPVRGLIVMPFISGDPNCTVHFVYDGIEFPVNVRKGLYSNEIHSYEYKGVTYNKLPPNIQEVDVDRIIRFYDYAFEENEKKKKIRLIDSRYINQIIDEARDFLNAR